MSVPLFRSVMAPALQALVALRHSLGYRDRVVVSRLAHFDRFLVARDWTAPFLTREMVEEWLRSDGPLQPRGVEGRVSTMRILGRFLLQSDLPTYIPGPLWQNRETPRFRPHIYSATEIRALLAEAARLTPVGSLRPTTYVTLLGLLYCSGLRISEALALRLMDVDLEEGRLIVRESKFHKSRAVPLQSDTVSALRAYRLERDARGCRRDEEASFFVNERRAACAYPTVVGVFLGLARRAGVRGPAGMKGARLHDLRHTFAVHRLVSWYRDGGDVETRLHLLTTYLGHVSIVSTQVYLDTTAELLGEAARRFQAPRLARLSSDPQEGGTP